MSDSSRPEMPATVYKHGSQFDWDGELFDSLVVHSDEEYDEAVKDGWVAHKPAPKPTKPKPAPKPE